ncbi:hypothetical protein [Romboutsia hominis]|uniref:hypothetical protein n=1 Tax=Romboutsia hominis TaxID=1507512 RepID=UPI001F060CF5|nr:hypothetical protein [Romboutsia hominis]MCH1960624.1 hypothetical protein [Romboutsia hominis]MCH1968944.1 hypothetical protein [Romboutsia hominis]
MALYRYVRVEFWKNPKVLEEMTPEDKLFMLYLLTNPSTTQIGIYRLSKKQMAFELGYSVESISCMIDRFVNVYGAIKYNEDTREIGIKNWGKYNFSRLGKPMIDCIKKELLEVEDKSMIEFVLQKINSLTVRDLYEQYLNTSENICFDDTLTSRTTIRGQKEKQKQKQKEKENNNIENDLAGGSIYGYGDKSIKNGKYSREYKDKNGKSFKKPSEEELEFARGL